jgi:hypothetical protein
MPGSARRSLVIGAFVCLAMIGLHFSVPAFGFQSDPQPIPAAKAILRSFDTYRVVALGDAHGLQQEHAFIQSLIRNPEFPSKVRNIVVECGNALYQDIIDRYVSGQYVPVSELRQVWRNTTQSPYGPWDAIVYQQLFTAVREVNGKLPPVRRLRIIAGDPPIDWSKIQRRTDADAFLNQRDSFFASAVEQALQGNQKALVIAGVGHVLKAQPRPPASLLKSTEGPDTSRGQPHLMPPNLKKLDPKLGPSLPAGVRPGNVTALLQERFPGSTLVIVPHTGFGNSAPLPEDLHGNLEGRLATWPKPSLILLKDTWLGALGAGEIYPGVIGPDGQLQNPYSGITAADLADAYMYFGLRDSLTWSQTSPEPPRDEAYLGELNRRARIMFGQPYDPRNISPRKR